ncbi:hypothetical protein EYF80_026312 [Liparis tanakae]|uniref:Uncharacterized protein n=1 Tax=Liparis tanakae TaxID=230148 RepID=A0A4Z2HF93_9TELE|nr:hypothetical protein EYF80_026312 [Liparis tanakae]
MGTLEPSGMLFSALYCWIITVPNSSSNYMKDNDKRHAQLQQPRRGGVRLLRRAEAVRGVRLRAALGGFRRRGGSGLSVSLPPAENGVLWREQAAAAAAALGLSQKELDLRERSLSRHQSPVKRQDRHADVHI